MNVAFYLVAFYEIAFYECSVGSPQWANRFSSMTPIVTTMGSQWVPLTNVSQLGPERQTPERQNPERQTPERQTPDKTNS